MGSFFAKDKVKIEAIECGVNHCMVLTKYDADIYCFGHNDCCQLGNGLKHRFFVSTPQINKFLKNELIVDIKCGAYHNMAMSAKNEYFFWGSNGNNECMVYVDENECVRLFGYEENIQFVKEPTKYQHNARRQQIVSVHLGYNCTKIVFKYDAKKGENSLQENCKNKAGIKQKLKKFKSWFRSKKSPKFDAVNRSSSESLSSFE